MPVMLILRNYQSGYFAEYVSIVTIVAHNLGKEVYGNSPS